MKNPIPVDIKESLTELKKPRSKQPTLLKQKRVDCLILLKTSKFETREELANHLRITHNEKYLTNFYAAFKS